MEGPPRVIRRGTYAQERSWAEEYLLSHGVPPTLDQFIEAFPHTSERVARLVVADL